MPVGEARAALRQLLLQPGQPRSEPRSPLDVERGQGVRHAGDLHRIRSPVAEREGNGGALPHGRLGSLELDPDILPHAVDHHLGRYPLPPLRIEVESGDERIQPRPAQDLLAERAKRCLEVLGGGRAGEGQALDQQGRRGPVHVGKECGDADGRRQRGGEDQEHQPPPPPPCSRRREETRGGQNQND